ncbi:MAG: hypothetical protein FJX20_12995 [Alphaproteobacteria bacterium]|nr:hypothetical protein [Alphaproteobacteria bacterium]
MLRKLRLAILATAAAGLVVTTLWQDSLSSKYASYPRTPDPALNRTVAYTPKKTVHYITERERAEIAYLQWAFVACAVIVGASLLSHRKWPLDLPRWMRRR